IEVGGYTEDEKIEIGRRYLIKRQLQAHGLPKGSVEIPEKLWTRIVRDYTREAGVRQLDREIATICRKVARDIVRGKTSKVRLTDQRLEEYLGPSKYTWDLQIGGANQIGLAIGLGTTEIGGEMIPVEVATMPGRGNLTITGQAGDVMQESAQAALSYARSRAEQLKIDKDFREKLDLHIHLPEGAQPKDGPSAGITMASALISALTKQPVRNDTAMTGEITLRGRVLAIGGLKDKTLAAHRHGIRRLIAPLDNKRDLAKIPANVAKEMEFVWVSNMDEVIAAAIMLDEEQVGGIVSANEAEAAKSAVIPPTSPDSFSNLVTDANPGDRETERLRLESRPE
ncbi:MAG: hypothetical protein IT336_00290, partial [Thermomicrobiales bacterium]|nr:hypothetical protein [Thermomicrobiales bacterium]